MEVVIYRRYSCELQNPKSTDDQEREVREGLARMGIDASNALVISDAAVSGTTTTGREGFETIRDRVRQGKPFLLAVDDQSRLSRLDNAFALITDLVFAGGRFISTGEHIDTNTPGWKLRVRVMELHHSTCSDETGNRVRRGQHSRIVQGLSAGDFPYGYESYFLDEKYATTYCGRGPKPEKGIRINEVQAKWVRWIYKQFADGKSINWIARELSKRKVPRDRRARASRWFAPTIRKMLDNAKYIGIWPWGKMTMIRDSTGRKKQIEAARDKIVTDERPTLRIIAQELWERVQTRLAELRQKTGKKPGQASRAPKVHYSKMYPRSIAQFLFVCGHCGAKTHHQGRGKHVYRACVNSLDGRDACPGRPRVPEKLACSILLSFIGQLLRSLPEWIDAAVSEMTAAIRQYHEQLPTDSGVPTLVE